MPTSSRKNTEQSLKNISVMFLKLKNMSYDDIDTIIEWMINKHLILRTKERYPVLHSTYEGLHYSKYLGIKEIKQLKNL